MEIIARKDAKAKGLLRYFTGKPCIRGHVCERNVCGNCTECNRERRSDPEYKYKAKIAAAKPEAIAKVKAYNSRPEVKAMKKERENVYFARPEVMARKKVTDKARNARPEVIARKKARNKLPEVIARNKTYRNKPEAVAKSKVTTKARNDRPEVIARKKARAKVYDARPEVKAKKATYQRENRPYFNAYHSRRRTHKVSNTPSWALHGEAAALVDEHWELSPFLTKVFKPPRPYEVDHIIPISCGGGDTPDNLTWLPQSANRSKSGKSGMWFPKENTFKRHTYITERGTRIITEDT